MTIAEARELIAPVVLTDGANQQWADLGCGTGTFSYALATLLPGNSRIVCVDKELQAIKPLYDGVHLEFNQADIQEIDFAPRSLSGILMANSLHYVKNQPKFIERISQFLNKNASFIIIEYDTDVSNQWVPYPLSFNTLSKLLKGYGKVRKLNERPSIYGSAHLYACQVSR